MVQFVFSDADDKVVALHVRRGVVEFVDNPDRYYRPADFTLTLTRRGPSSTSTRRPSGSSPAAAT
jgi:hypothetical protein